MIFRTFKSFSYALRGLGNVVRYENNARIHLVATVIVAVTGGILQISWQDWCWLVTAVSMVWITETINTAIEKLVDLVSPGHNEKAGAVKDIAAGAVLLASIFAAVIGGIIFYRNISTL